MKPRMILGSILLAGISFASFAPLVSFGSDLPGPPEEHGNGIGPGHTTREAAQMIGVGEWQVEALFTVGDRVIGFRPPGFLDGIGALALDHRVVRVFANHELSAGNGYFYGLANGTRLTGARITYFDIDLRTRKLLASGLAYHTVVDRRGNVVTRARQINEGLGTPATDGFDRFCSGHLIRGGTYDFEEDIYFAGEETNNGQAFALDVHEGTIYCVPMLGRAAFENVTPVDTGDPNTVGLLIGDDRAPAPLFLYVGEKNALGDGSFLDRNGLAMGKLYVWVSDKNDSNPSTFHGTGKSRNGKFARIVHYDPDKAGTPGYDGLGFARQGRQNALVNAAKGFLFSRPEDVATNPADGTQAVMASTGRGTLFGGVDDWGTTYLVDLEFGVPITGRITILYDGDDAGNGQFSHPDRGLRSPDNLDWAGNGMIYIQEDRATRLNSFGEVSRMEVSLWELDPESGILKRAAIVDRSAVPTGQNDPAPGDLGNWETSGVLDVTGLFRTLPGELLLIAHVQAHSLRGAPLGGSNQSRDLVEGGQLLLLSRRDVPPAIQARVPSENQGTTILYANVPNPFNPATTISFEIARPGPVSLVVFDVAGHRVRTLLEEVRERGKHSVPWDGRDETGSLVGSGVYFYSLQHGGDRVTRRMLMLK